MRRPSSAWMCWIVGPLTALWDISMCSFAARLRIPLTTRCGDDYVFQNTKKGL